MRSIAGAAWSGPDGSGGRGFPAARHPWWSLTKTAIAAAALRLAERGRLDLDAPRPVATLRQMLGHTAGLPDYGTLDGYHAAVAAREAPWTRGELMARLAPADPPGTGWRYSNVGYLLVREAVEAASDAPLADVLAREIAVPLGLRATRLVEDTASFDALHGMAGTGYDPGWVFHGCLAGPADEAVRFLDGLLDGALVGPASLAAMLRRRPVAGTWPGRPWTEAGYGLGLMTGRMGAAGPAIGHSGAGPHGGCAVYRFAATGRTVACFSDAPGEALPEAAAAALPFGESA